MKTLLRTFLLVCVMTFLTGVIQAAVSYVNSDRQSATGAGQIQDDSLGTKQTLAFSAIRLPDGTVMGEAEYHFVRNDPTFGENSRLHVEIKCLNVVGNTAVMSGIVRNSNNPESEGVPAIFSVQDNGEGNGNIADQISPVIPNLNLDPETACFRSAFLLSPITSGNVQVRP